MVKLRDHYDWVVLGDHPGALLSGCLVAGAGLSVLCLPYGPEFGTRVRKEGQLLDPEPNFLMGVVDAEKTQGLLSRCLESLGVPPSEREIVRKLGVLPQVATPGKRVMFTAQDADVSYELEREFGPKTASDLGLAQGLSLAETLILDFWRRLPDRLTLAEDKKSAAAKAFANHPEEVRRELRKHAASSPAAQASSGARKWLAWDEGVERWERAGDAPGFTQVMQGLWTGITGLPADRVRLFEIVEILSLARTGAAYPGGMGAFRKFLLALAARLGAHLPDEADTRRVFAEEGRLIGVQIAKRGSVIGVGGGVLGCSIEHIEGALSMSGKKRRRHLKAVPTPAGWRFTLALTVGTEAIPPGVLARTVWKEPGAPALDIEIVNPKEYGLSENGHRFLFVRTLLPFDAESLEPRFQAVVAGRMFRQLIELMPFLEYHVVRVYPDFRRPELDDFKEAYPFESLAGMPECLRVVSDQGLSSGSGIEGLFVATGEAYPRLGSLGWTVAALEATAWIAHRSGLAGPLAR